MPPATSTTPISTPRGSRQRYRPGSGAGHRHAAALAQCIGGRGADVERRKRRQQRFRRPQPPQPRRHVGLGERVERHRIGQREAAARRAPQRRKMCAAAQRGAEVLGQHADVGALAAGDFQRGQRRLPVAERDPLDHAPRAPRDRARRPGAHTCNTDARRASAPNASAASAGCGRETAAAPPRWRRGRIRPRAVAITSPSTSPVVVRTPKRTCATYDLCASSSICANLVASPKHSGRSPVAKGSSVPVCPAFSASNRRFAACSAAFDVMPAGLSSSSTPSTRRRGRRGCDIVTRRRGCGRRRRPRRSASTGASPTRSSRRRRNGVAAPSTSRQATRQLAAKEAGGVLEGRDGLRRTLLARQMREVHRGVGVVGADVDERHGDAAYARILDPIGQKIGKLALELIADTLRSLGVLFHFGSGLAGTLIMTWVPAPGPPVHRHPVAMSQCTQHLRPRYGDVGIFYNRRCVDS